MLLHLSAGLHGDEEPPERVRVSDRKKDTGGERIAREGKREKNEIRRKDAAQKSSQRDRRVHMDGQEEAVAVARCGGGTMCGGHCISASHQ